jgi:hypothetical protein
MANRHKFWVLDRPAEDDNTAYATIGGAGDLPIWTTSQCSACGRLWKKKQIRSLRVELYGSSITDFIWCDSDEIIISESLKNLFMKSDLGGLDFRQIDVVAWWRVDPATSEMVDWGNYESPPPLFQMVILGKGGSILPQNKVHVKSACNVCGVISYEPLQNGISVDVNQWDGSDFFVMDEFPGYVLMTERALNFLDENRVRNFIATPAESFSMA